MQALIVADVGEHDVEDADARALRRRAPAARRAPSAPRGPSSSARPSCRRRSGPRHDHRAPAARPRDRSARRATPSSARSGWRAARADRRRLRRSSATVGEREARDPPRAWRVAARTSARASAAAAAATLDAPRRRAPRARRRRPPPRARTSASSTLSRLPIGTTARGSTKSVAPLRARRVDDAGEALVRVGADREHVAPLALGHEAVLEDRPRACAISSSRRDSIRSRAACALGRGAPRGAGARDRRACRRGRTQPRARRPARRASGRSRTRRRAAARARRGACEERAGACARRRGTSRSRGAPRCESAAPMRARSSAGPISRDRRDAASGSPASVEIARPRAPRRGRERSPARDDANGRARASARPTTPAQRRRARRGRGPTRGRRASSRGQGFGRTWGAVLTHPRVDPRAMRPPRNPLRLRPGRFATPPAPLGIGFCFALEVAEDGARIDAEVARGLRAVAVVALEHLEDVLALELLLRLLEREDRRSRAPGPRSRSSGAEQRLVAEDERLLDAVLELADVAGPVVLADRARAPAA